jgi:hypothetical protein
MTTKLLALPLLICLCLYSFAKRFTQWTHFLLGGAIALSPVGTSDEWVFRKVLDHYQTNYKELESKGYRVRSTLTGF